VKQLLAAVLMLLAVPLAGCGEAPSPAPAAQASAGGTTSTGSPAAESPNPVDRPPPLTLHLASGDLDLEPWTYCWTTACVDGVPRDDLADVGGPNAIDFSFPKPGWEFSATFSEHGEHRCKRRITVPAEPTGAGTWRVNPAGPAGAWDVDLFGNGPGGDVITSFTWTTPTDGTLPGPASGSAGVLADQDGELDSYGVEVAVADLASRPRSAQATVTVASADGRSVAFPTRRQPGCWSEGSLWFTAPDRLGRQATSLGPGPFTYTVELDLDGTTYTGVGEWPTDETEDIAPHVPLTWTPALPAYTG